MRRTWLRATVATCNLGRKAGQAETRRYLEDVHDGVPRGDHLTIIGFQEIGEGDRPGVNEHQLLREIFTDADGWHLAAMGTREPIAWRGGVVGDWHPVGPVVIDRAMAGVAHQSPGRSVQLELIDDATTDRLVAALNGHPPAGAYNGHRAPAIKRLLLAGWTRVFDTTQENMRLALRADADTFVTQDTNRRHVPRWLRSQVDAVPGRFIDRIACVPARGRIATVDARGQVDNPFERLHPCRWAIFTIRPKETR